MIPKPRQKDVFCKVNLLQLVHVEKSGIYPTCTWYFNFEKKYVTIWSEYHFLKQRGGK